MVFVAYLLLLLDAPILVFLAYLLVLLDAPLLVFLAYLLLLLEAFVSRNRRYLARAQVRQFHHSAKVFRVSASRSIFSAVFLFGAAELLFTCATCR